MSEYQHVEKPFLDQLSTLGWQVIDQGPDFPTDPTQSRRATFRETLLKDIFFRTVRDLNRTDDDRPWLTQKQLDELLDQLAHPPGNSLLEANEHVQALLYRMQVDRNELTGEEYPNVRIIDFHNPERNHFLAINQFRIDTPGCVKSCIIPDIVLFVNGLPLAVVECKDANQVQANPMYEAFRQLMRYSNQREATRKAGLREGEPGLFYTNQFLIRTSGDKADFGGITATEEEYFFPWRDIRPPSSRPDAPPAGQGREQETLIQGMLPKETLLDIVRTCVLFLDVGKTRAKIVARYQQYRAVKKIIHRLHTGRTPTERSGVIWHTQGSGKSLTMVFAIRKLRMCDDLKDYKVCLVNDRTDLEEQLGRTAHLTGETVTYIRSTAELKSRLATDASNLNMVMVHKFGETPHDRPPDYMARVMETPPRYETFGIVNPSERILLMIDEAHRSQAGDLGDNLFEAFPNAARLAFTGTPLIRVKDKKKTVERFGDYIDKYKLQDAVDDGATVQILYEGKTADSAIDHKHDFDVKIDALAEDHVASQMRKAENLQILERLARLEKRGFDDLYKERTAQEILALKQKWGTTGDILEADRRIEAIAHDLVNHYIDNILPNGFKAQVVCASKTAAVKYKTFIDQALSLRLDFEKTQPEPDPDLCRRIEFLQSVVVVSSEGTNEKAEITHARKHAKEVDAVENFKRPFNYDDPQRANTGIAFLIVVDMLLTGFDAPFEQVMYIDKKIKDHNLLQAIARVNRIAKGKTRGYIVDYIGLANHLKEALSIYDADDREDVEGTLTDIAAELPVLESRYQRLLNLFKDNGIADIRGYAEQTVSDERAAEVVEQSVALLEEIRLRAAFEVYFKKLMQSMDIVLPHSAANPYRIPVKRFGYLLIQVKERYKDETLTISGAGEKVRRIIDAHLVSLGINPKIPPVELFSDRFISEIEKNQTARAKASEMEHAIRKHCKVRFEEDPALYKRLSEKLEALIKQYKDHWDDLYKLLFELREEAKRGRPDAEDGVSAKEAPFYDLILTQAFDGTPTSEETLSAVKALTADIFLKLKTAIDIIDFWNNEPEISKLRGDLSDMLVMSGIDEIAEKSDVLVTEIAALAKVRHRDIVG